MPEKIIQEYRGIRDLVAAELITDTAYELTYGTPFPIAGIAELTRATESSSEAHYYDNIAAIVIDTVGADTVTCNTSAIPLDVLAKLTGQYYDNTTGTFVEGEANCPYFAIGYVTEDTAGNEVYVWRHKVKCSIPDSTHATKNDGTDANGQELTFTGINTVHKFTKTGKTAKAINHKAGNFITESDFFKTPQDIDTLTAIAPIVPEAVVFSPVDGTTFTDSLTVTLFCATPSASIQYQIGGNQPSGTWHDYEGPITLTETGTVWAKAMHGTTAGTTTKATYTKSTD